jgi:hypothetical protein
MNDPSEKPSEEGALAAAVGARVKALRRLSVVTPPTPPRGRS